MGDTAGQQLGVFSRAAQPDRTLKFIRAAYAWLVVASFMAPLFLFYSRATGQLFAHSYMGAYRHAFTVGFISLMIMGVAARVVPILAGVDGSRISSLWGPFLLINLGCLGRVSLQIATDFAPQFAYSLIGLTGFIELTALSWWGFEMWRTMNLARTHRTRFSGRRLCNSGAIPVRPSRFAPRASVARSDRCEAAQLSE